MYDVNTQTNEGPDTGALVFSFVHNTLYLLVSKGMDPEGGPAHAGGRGKSFTIVPELCRITFIVCVRRSFFPDNW